VVTVPLVRGADGLPVSSRRIRAGLIAPDGRRRAPLPVAVCGAGRHDCPALAGAIVRVLPKAVVRFVAPGQGTRIARRLGEAERLAEARATRALRGAEYGVGVSELAPHRGGAAGPRMRVVELRDDAGAVAPPMLVAGGEWAHALEVALSGRRPRPGRARRSRNVITRPPGGGASWRRTSG